MDCLWNGFFRLKLTKKCCIFETLPYMCEKITSVYRWVFTQFNNPQNGQKIMDKKKEFKLWQYRQFFYVKSLLIIIIQKLSFYNYIQFMCFIFLLTSIYMGNGNMKLSWWGNLYLTKMVILTFLYISQMFVETDSNVRWNGIYQLSPWCHPHWGWDGSIMGCFCCLCDTSLFSSTQLIPN